MFQRPHFKQLIERIQEPRKFIQVLAGPRQVGKSTLAGQVLEQSNQPFHYVSADAVAQLGEAWLEQQWETARQKWRVLGTPSFIFGVDEIQKISNWSEIVKANWDKDTREKTPIKLLLLGSSRLLLQQGLTESLAGRFELIYMGHWSLSEMESAFGFSPAQFAWFGGYPGAAELVSDETRWKKYIRDALIEPSILRDVLSLTRVDKPILLRRLFEFGCTFSGQILSYNKMLGQLQDAGNTTTLATYLELLESAGLLGGLEKFAADKIRQRLSSPKFQVHNSALISTQLPDRFEEITANSEKWGRIIESAVGAHLINHARQSGFEVFYWREGNDEIDFVLKIRGKIIGIEVKSGVMHGAGGMEVFRKKFNPDKMLLIAPSALSWEEFLKINPIDLV